MTTTVKDVKAHCEWLMSKGRENEPMIGYLPKVEAQRRKQNPEGHKRVIFVVDSELYKDWHTQKDRYVTLCFNNPSLAHPIMLQILAAVSDDVIQGMAKADHDVEHAGE